MLKLTFKKNFGKIAIIILIGGILCLAAISLTMAKTSSTEYCISCHEIAPYKAEMEKSSHAVTKDKKPIECRDCHIPNNFGGRYLIVKIVLGMGDVISHHFGDPENLDRREMQKKARKFIPDGNCRKCHEDLTKNVKDEELSEIGKLCHEAYLEKNGQTRRGCAGCHFNMAHLPDYDRRYTFNEKFAKNLPLKKEAK
jgi:cytochrome c-type protein NapC